MKLSKQAWDKSKNIYESIIRHPFNQELMKGTLAKDKFAYYIEQDSLYLQEFARCHAIIASKVPLKYMTDFLSYAHFCFITEQEVVHQFFAKIFNLKATGMVSSATYGYTSNLLKVCLNEQVEVAIASILPCFWVYREVGLYIAKFAKQNNPYIRWIETYTSKEFSDAVDAVINIFDILADNASKETRSKMLEEFYKNTVWEWHFWNDAYNKKVFDNLSK
jgi:thiaminase (transcriptional activator TenA)